MARPRVAAWLAPLLLGFVLRPVTGVPWWQFVPLGLFERGVALTEVAAVLVMGLWAAGAGRTEFVRTRLNRG